MGGSVSRLCIKNTNKNFKTIKNIIMYEREKYDKNIKK